MGAADLSELSCLEKIKWLTADEKEQERALSFTDALLPKQKNWINEWF